MSRILVSGTPSVFVSSTPIGKGFCAAWWRAFPRMIPWVEPDAQHRARGHVMAAIAAFVPEAQILEGLAPRFARAAQRIAHGGRTPEAEQEARRQARASIAPPTEEELAWFRALVGVPRGIPISAANVLEVPSTASPDELRRAWRRLAKATHPDHGGDPKAFQRVAQAYQEACAALQAQGTR